MDDPILAERVRSVRYEPLKYDYEDKVKEDRKQTGMKDSMRKEEQAKSSSNGAKAMAAALDQSQSQNNIGASSGSSVQQKRQWTVDPVTQKPQTTTSQTRALETVTPTKKV